MLENWGHFPNSTGYQDDQIFVKIETQNQKVLSIASMLYVSMKKGQYENVFQNFAYYYKILIPGNIYLQKIATLWI